MIKLRLFLTFFLSLSTICVCVLQGQDCLGDLFIEPFEECNSNGSFNVDISFAEISGNELGFFLFVNDELIDTYPNYPETFITIEDFAPGNSQEITVLITDVQDPTCESSYSFFAPLCELDACDILDLSYELTACDEAGNVFIILDFFSESTGTQFVLEGAGTIGGVFNYGSVPITIGPYPGNSETLAFEIIDLNDPSCSAEITLELSDCSVFCEIGPVTFEISECNNAGNVTILLESDYTNTGDQFILGGIGNGIIYDYTDLPITLPNIPANGTTLALEFVDLENEQCFTVVEIELPNCSDECTIYDIQPNPISCDGENSYLLDLFFLHGNTTSEFFNVYSSGTLLGSWQYEELPISIDSFPERTTSDYDIITICDGEDMSCCMTLEFMGLTCEDLCSVNNLFAEPYETCNDDGTFNVDIEFEVLNGNESGFDLFVDSAFHSYFFAYPTDFITIVATAAPNTEVEIMVTDNDNGGCSSTFTITSPDCAGMINSTTIPTTSLLNTFDIFTSNSTLFVQNNDYSIHPIHFSISNSIGTKIKQELMDKSMLEIDLSDFITGVYFVTLAIDNEMVTQKIFIQ